MTTTQVFLAALFQDTVKMPALARVLDLTTLEDAQIQALLEDLRSQGILKSWVMVPVEAAKGSLEETVDFLKSIAPKNQRVIV